MCLPITDLVDSRPSLEMWSDWPQNPYNLDKMLIQERCCSSNGKWQCHSSYNMPGNMKGSKTVTQTMPVQVEFSLERLEMVKARHRATIPLSCSIYLICLNNKCEGVYNLVGNKGDIYLARVLSKQPVDTRSRREYRYSCKKSYQLFRVSFTRTWFVTALKPGFARSNVFGGSSVQYLSRDTIEKTGLWPNWGEHVRVYSVTLQQILKFFPWFRETLVVKPTKIPIFLSLRSLLPWKTNN